MSNHKTEPYVVCRSDCESQRVDEDTVILVQPDNPLDVKPEALQGLVEGIRELGKDARIAYHDPKAGAFGVTWWEVVTIWVGAEVSKAVKNR